MFPTSPNVPLSSKFTSPTIMWTSLSALINQPAVIQIVTLLFNASFKFNHELLELMSFQYTFTKGAFNTCLVISGSFIISVTCVA